MNRRDDTQAQSSDEYTLIVFHETERAYSVGFELADADLPDTWLPKSRVTKGRQVGKVGEYEVFEFTIPDWLAIEKDLA